MACVTRCVPHERNAWDEKKKKGKKKQEEKRLLLPSNRFNGGVRDGHQASGRCELVLLWLGPPKSCIKIQNRVPHIPVPCGIGSEIRRKKTQRHGHITMDNI